ncbi:MAG: hypothetical protein ACLFQV_07690 [Vulcanimicrobiota bacterium]
MKKKVMSKEIMNAIQNWKEQPRKIASDMVAKYGEPDKITSYRLIWHNPGPVKRIILYNFEVEHLFPKPHKDSLEHVMNYKIKPEVVGKLAMFDGSVLVDITRGNYQHAAILSP